MTKPRLTLWARLGRAEVSGGWQYLVIALGLLLGFAGLVAVVLGSEWVWDHAVALLGR